jgi:hypothetical protein
MVKYNEDATLPPQALLDAIARNRPEAKQAGALWRSVAVLCNVLSAVALVLLALDPADNLMVNP